ncbi:MAG TPA: hypothetical protein VNL77_11670 [Roseiflexaceae bacterium]|nr:hypothetical protein [Roseiflexaceae bacterium]
MNNQVLRIVVVVATIFPFAVLGYQIFTEESLLTGAVYTTVVLILFGTALAAARVRPGPEKPPSER